MDTPASQPTPEFEERCIAITEADRRMFGCEPTPGTVEHIIGYGYSSEMSAQLLYDIKTVTLYFVDLAMTGKLTLKDGVPVVEGVED